MPMRTLLICHDIEPLSRIGLAQWLGSFSDLVGIVELQETRGRMYKRIRREVKRVGLLRFFDVLAFRFYYKAFLSKGDAAWEAQELARLQKAYPDISGDTRLLKIHSPNAPEAEDFIRDLKPDFVIARCKTLLKESVFSIPRFGTFVMHPGVCPEYRNAHGCFWALAQDDMEKVGMTLLKIDKGVDTGPVYGYYSYDFDEVAESHIVIQNRVVLENLEAMADRFREIEAGEATTIDTSGRPSGTWGQPWMSKYLRWKRKARQRNS